MLPVYSIVACNEGRWHDLDCARERSQLNLACQRTGVDDEFRHPEVAKHAVMNDDNELLHVFASKSHGLRWA